MLVRVCEANNRPVGRSSPVSFVDTSAPDATKLEGLGYQYGGSVNYISPSGLGAALGGELNVIPDQINNSKYYGLTGAVGIEDIPGMEGHVEVGNTTTFAGFNIYDAMSDVYHWVFD